MFKKKFNNNKIFKINRNWNLNKITKIIVIMTYEKIKSKIIKNKNEHE